jgi:hypothetical protein
MKADFFFKIFPSTQHTISHIFDVASMGSGCTVKQYAVNLLEDFHRHLESIPAELHETLILTYLNQIKGVPNCSRLSSDEVLNQLIINATLFEVLFAVTHEEPYGHLCPLTDEFKSDRNYLEIVRSVFNVEFYFSGYIESSEFKNKVQNFLKFPFLHQNSMKECRSVHLGDFVIEKDSQEWEDMEAFAKLGVNLELDKPHTIEEGIPAYIKLVEDLFYAVRSSDVKILNDFDLQFFLKDKVSLVGSNGEVLAQAECSSNFHNFIEPSGYITCFYVMDSYLNLVVTYIELLSLIT